MATLTVQVINLDGAHFSATSAAEAGDEFANDGRTFFHVTGGGSPITVTFTGYGTSNFGQTPDKVISISKGKTYMIGPFLQTWFDDPNNNVQVTYSAHEGIDVAAVRLVDPVVATR